MLSIDQYAYSSRLKSKDPQEKLVFALMTLGVCLWADSLAVSLLVIMIMVGATVYIGGTPLLVFLKLLLIPMPFLMLGVLTIACGLSGDAQDYLYAVPVRDMYLGVSRTGLITATVLFFKAWGAVSCLYYLSLSTPLVDLLSTLRKLKCPKLITEMMGLIYRFIFVLLTTAETIYTAQNSRLGYFGVVRSYYSMGALISNLFIRVYKRADELYSALEARGYEDELQVLEEPFTRNWTGYAVPVVINAVLIITALLLRSVKGELLK